MEHTYTIRAADGQEYGPATLEQLTEWIREGRVGPQTEIRRSDMQQGALAASFVELQSLLTPARLSDTPAPISTSAAAPSSTDPVLVAQLKSGASWFYWIAALSFIGSLAATGGWGLHFLFGLGVTRQLDYLGAQFGGSAKIVTLALNALVAGIFILFGVLAGKRHLWAFIVGLALFAIDTVLMMLAQDWLSVAFHAFALFFIYRGLQACRALNEN